MGDEISNKTLALLVIAAIVVSLSGTFLSLNKLSEGGLRGITGLALDDTGTATVEIQSFASIKFSDDAADLGTGYANASAPTGVATTCSVWTRKNGAGSQGNPNCGGDFEVPSGAGGNSLEIENDGTENLSVNITSDKNTADIFTGDEATPLFKFYVNNSEAGSCSNPHPDVFENVNKTSAIICPNLGWDTTDTLFLHLNFTVVTDEVQESDVITFTVTGTALP